MPYVSAKRCITPRIRRCSKLVTDLPNRSQNPRLSAAKAWYVPNETPSHDRPKPIRNITNVRFSIFLSVGTENSKLNFRNEIKVEIPIMNMKNGKIRSVGVNPFHSACLNGAYICPHDPGLFTSIIPAMVIPLKTSRDKRRLLAFASII